jgi:hypothetical protein
MTGTMWEDTLMRLWLPKHSGHKKPSFAEKQRDWTPRMMLLALKMWQRLYYWFAQTKERGEERSVSTLYPQHWWHNFTDTIFHSPYMDARNLKNTTRGKEWKCIPQSGRSSDSCVPIRVHNPTEREKYESKTVDQSELNACPPHNWLQLNLQPQSI